MINNIVNLNMTNGITVKVDKGNSNGISIYELQDHIEDLFKIKKSYKSKEVIKLSNFSDSMFDLVFCGCNRVTKEILFKIC